MSALNKFNNFGQRVIVGLTGVAIIITGVVMSPWAYCGIFFLICMFSILEFYKLSGLDGLIPLKSWGTLIGLYIFLISFLIEFDILAGKYYYTILPLAACIFFINLYRQNSSKPFTNIAYTFLGIIYVSVPFALLNIIAFYRDAYSYEIILGILLLIWASDTGAYFTGKKFGKTKLFERVSPKKSWEGFLGGMALNLIIAIILGKYFSELFIWQWIVIGVIISIAGTYGDLVESLFKRGIEIKDSSHSIPGHGGFLDRFDGLLLSIPFILAFLKLT